MASSAIFFVHKHGYACQISISQERCETGTALPR
jgi:hypothetical protein